MTERVRKLKANAVPETYPLCIERLRISFDVLYRMKGEHILKIRAQEQADILDRMPISIEEGDLICGVGASKPNGIEMDYERGIWTPDEIASLKGENYTIEPEEEAELYEFMDRFSRDNLGQTEVAATVSYIGDNDKVWKLMNTGIIPPAWKSKKTGMGGGMAQSGLGMGPGGFLLAIDFEKLLHQGARSIIDQCKKNLDELFISTQETMHQKFFWQGVITIFEAWIRHAHRYSALAAKLSETEPDPVRAAELRRMSEICLRVPEYPARDFREAVQSFWFAFMLTVPSPAAPGARFDQYMYPFYKKDIEAGKITDDEVLELLEIIRIKDFQFNRVKGMSSRKQNAGMAKWHNWTLGGVDREGNCAVNELTYLEMKAALETQIPHHTITLRVADNTPIETIVKGLEVVRTGTGMPAFVSDKSYIQYFMDHGMSLEDARDYCMCGCLDGIIPHKTRGQAAPMFVVALAYDIFLHNGYCPSTDAMVGMQTGDVTTEFATFEEHKQAFFRQLHYLLGLGFQYLNARICAFSHLCPDIFRSALMDGGIEEGKEVMWRTFQPYDCVCACSAVGVINTANSLAAVKKLVYDEKKYTMAQLMAALDADWVGYEEMQRDFLAAPKYGNNVDLPDQLAAEVYAAYAKSVESYPTPTGGTHVPNAISITAHQPGGAVTGATPDGRKRGETLADGSISPVQGTDKNGPLAVLQSGMKINQDAFQAMLLNMKFHPTALKTDEDLVKLANLIKTYLTSGGKHVQFNVVAEETLRAAQKSPEEYKDLIIRIAGYSTYFTLLSSKIQEEVIKRTTHDL